MSEVYFCSDLHLDHKAIKKFRPYVLNRGIKVDFQTVAEHNFLLLDNINSTVTKRDVLYIVGDIAFSDESLELIRQIVCPVIAVLGNHDECEMLRYVDVFSDVKAFVRYKKFWISHCPIHPDELRGKHNIHGHVHYSTINDPRYINVSVDNINYAPISLMTIKQHIEQNKVVNFQPIVTQGT